MWRFRVYLPVSLALALALLGGALAVALDRHHSTGSAAQRAQWVGSSGNQPRVQPESPSPSPPASASPPPASPSPPPRPASPEPTLQVPHTPLTVAATDFFGWALLNRRTGEISGSPNMATGTSSTESMIKAWIVADYLRTRPADAQPDAGTLAELSAAIIHSDDNAAEKYYQLGGGDAVVDRMISMCGLTNTSVYSGWWSRTQMSPLDAVRMGQCVANGTAAGPTWTGWVLGQMAGVQGTVADQQPTTGGGRWGIVDGLPASLTTRLAIKNGWTALAEDGNWHVNNLAISGDWVLAVMTRYPIAEGLQYGADICSSLARQLLSPPA